jgi:hypothetical protein
MIEIEGRLLEGKGKNAVLQIKRTELIRQIRQKLDKEEMFKFFMELIYGVKERSKN